MRRPQIAFLTFPTCVKICAGRWKCRRVFLAAAAVAVLGLFVVSKWLAREPEPVYGGKVIGKWIMILASVDAPSLRSSNLLGWTNYFDARAIPFAVNALAEADGPWRKAYQTIWPRLPGWLGSRLGPPNSAPRTRRAGLFILGIIGSDSEPAIPSVIQLWKTDEDFGVRRMAADTLLRIGGKDTRVTLAMVEGLQDQNAHIRRVAAERLGTSSFEPTIVAPALVRSLADSDLVVREQAAQSLRHLANADSIAIQELRKLLQDSDPFISLGISNILNQIERRLP